MGGRFWGSGRGRGLRRQRAGSQKRARSRGWWTNLAARNTPVRRGELRNGESLEGDVFVVYLGAGGILDVSAGLVEVLGTAGAGNGAGGHAFSAPTEHPEIVGNDFEAGALLALLVLPFAGLDATFDKNERALL